MDIVLDLWLHTIYQDSQVQGSDKGPVVYFRNGTGNPLTNFSDLAQRWGISKSTVSRILNKLEVTDSKIRDEQICVPSEENSVSKPHMRAMVRKVAKVLATQGLP